MVYSAIMATNGKRMNGELKLKDNLAVAVDRVQRTRTSIPIRRNGRIVAAVVTAEDLRTLEAIDRRDAQIAHRAEARARARGEKPMTLAEAKKLLKL